MAGCHERRANIQQQEGFTWPSASQPKHLAALTRLIFCFDQGNSTFSGRRNIA